MKRSFLCLLLPLLCTVVVSCGSNSQIAQEPEVRNTTLPSKALLGHWVDDYGDSYYSAERKLYITKDGSRYDIDYKVVEEDPGSMTLRITIKTPRDKEFQEQEVYLFSEDALSVKFWAGDEPMPRAPLEKRYVDSAQGPGTSPPVAGSASSK